MVHTREEAWKEAQVGVVSRTSEACAGNDNARGGLSQPHRVARLADRKGFRTALGDVLRLQGVTRHTRVVWVGDGAKGNWSLCESLCPRALQILDGYPLVEHAQACAEALLGKKHPCTALWVERIKQLAWQGDAREILLELRACRFEVGACQAHQDALRAFYRYVLGNRNRMNYPRARELGAPIGSGAVESQGERI